MKKGNNSQTNEFKVYVLPINSDDKQPAKLIRKEKEGKVQIVTSEFTLISSGESNWFMQIREIDQKLNKRGMRLLCNATSLGVNCYGFCANMENGSRAYRYDMHTVYVFEYSAWNKYATEKEQKEFFEFVKGKYKELTVQLSEAHDKGKSDRVLHMIQKDWLKHKGITLSNFWQKEFWK